MTTNTNAAQVAKNLIAVAEDQAFDAWYKQDCLVGGVNARIAARAAWNARAALTTAAPQPCDIIADAVRVPLDSLHADAEWLCARLLDKSLTREEVVTAIRSRIDAAKAALTTAAAVPPEGFVMVPVELANRVQESLGEFLMDHGWSQRDMDTSDDFGAVLLAAAPKAEPVPETENPVSQPAGEYPPLPLPDFGRARRLGAAYYGDAYTADQMRAYADATCAMRAQAAPAAVAGMSEAVAYLDIGGGGYLDLGSDLSDEALRKLPKGRNMLAIVGTYGVDGYVPVAPPTTQQEAAYTSVQLAEMVLSDCGHSSNYKPLLERVAGRIDRHVERLLTVQQADRALRAQAAPAAVASPLTKLQRKAIAVCFTSDKVSVSEVQRKLSISYADAQTLCQSIVDLGLTDELELAPSLKQRGAPAPQAAPTSSASVEITDEQMHQGLAAAFAHPRAAAPDAVFKAGVDFGVSVALLQTAPTTQAAPAWANQAVIEYQYTGGTHWCELGPAERMRTDFDGVYRLQPGTFPTQAAPQPAVQQGDDLQTFAIGDSNYAAGMLLGWNLCTAGMDAEFSRIREDRMRAAVQASRAAHPAAPVAQGDARAGKFMTVVYRDISPGEEARALCEHPKASAMSWSHALNERDAARAAVQAEELPERSKPRRFLSWACPVCCASVETTP